MVKLGYSVGLCRQHSATRPSPALRVWAALREAAPLPFPLHCPPAPSSCRCHGQGYPNPIPLVSRALPLGTRDDLSHTVQSFVSSPASRNPARSVHPQSGAPQYRTGSKIPAPPHPSFSGRGLREGAGLAAARCEWRPLRLRSLMAEA